MRLLIDADSLIYASGFAANKSDFITNVEYLENMIDPMLDRFTPDEYTIFLSGSNNFRHEVATILPYKGNRDPAHRPKYYKELREYLVNEHKAVVTENIEADDAVGLAQTDETIICSIDKDLWTVPGSHFNIKSGELTNVSEEQAMQNFFTQCLTGDKSDNIPGIKNPSKSHHYKPPNFTPDTATEILEGKTIQEQCNEVVKLYKGQYGKIWRKALHEVMTLLWIQRKGQITYKDCNLFKVKNVK